MLKFLLTAFFFYYYYYYSTALKRPVSVAGVAKSILFLASESWSSDIMGQIINVDSGKNGKLLWPHPTDTRPSTA